MLNIGVGLIDIYHEAFARGCLFWRKWKKLGEI